MNKTDLDILHKPAFGEKGLAKLEENSRLKQEKDALLLCRNLRK